MVDVCLPGTGGMMPLVNRWLSCCWLEYMGKAILIDCGEGTQIALKAAGIKVGRLETLLITHYHADHVAGLPGLLLTLGKSNRTSPLTIIGPIGLAHIVSCLMAIAPALPYPLRLMEWREDAPEQLEEEGTCISSLPLSHGIPCLGYHIAYKRKAVFNPDKANALHVPREMFRLLHDGQAATLSDGRVIEPHMVLDGMRNPIQVCYCTDTRTVSSLIAFAEDCDLCILEGMHGDHALREKMVEKGHMLFSDSAGIAKMANAKCLWLTHYSPALTDPAAYLDNAVQIFPNTVAAVDGQRMTL